MSFHGHAAPSGAEDGGAEAFNRRDGAVQGARSVPRTPGQTQEGSGVKRQPSRKMTVTPKRTVPRRHASLYNAISELDAACDGGSSTVAKQDEDRSMYSYIYPQAAKIVKQNASNNKVNSPMMRHMIVEELTLEEELKDLDSALKRKKHPAGTTTGAAASTDGDLRRRLLADTKREVELFRRTLLKVGYTEAELSPSKQVRVAVLKTPGGQEVLLGVDRHDLKQLSSSTPLFPSTNSEALDEGSPKSQRKMSYFHAGVGSPISIKAKPSPKKEEKVEQECSMDQGNASLSTATDSLGWRGHQKSMVPGSTTERPRATLKTDVVKFMQRRATLGVATPTGIVKNATRTSGELASEKIASAIYQHEPKHILDPQSARAVEANMFRHENDRGNSQRNNRRDKDVEVMRRVSLFQSHAIATAIAENPLTPLSTVNATAPKKSAPVNRHKSILRRGSVASKPGRRVSLVSTAVAVTQRRTPEANRSNEKLERSRHNDSEQVVKDRTIENMRQRGKSFRKSIFEILDESRGADEQKLSVLDENEEDDLEGSKDPHAEQDTVLATHPVSGITKADELVRRMTFVPPPPPRSHRSRHIQRQQQLLWTSVFVE